MKVYYESDVIAGILYQMMVAHEEGQTIALIELDRIETEAFLDEVPALTKRGDILKDLGCYFYKNIEIKLTLE